MDSFPGKKKKMPKELERKLKKTARKKFPGNKERQDRYTYGAMYNMGWRPGEGSGEHFESFESDKKDKH